MQPINPYFGIGFRAELLRLALQYPEAPDDALLLTAVKSTLDEDRERLMAAIREQQAFAERAV